MLRGHLEKIRKWYQEMIFIENDVVFKFEILRYSTAKKLDPEACLLKFRLFAVQKPSFGYFNNKMQWAIGLG